MIDNQILNYFKKMFKYVLSAGLTVASMAAGYMFYKNKRSKTTKIKTNSNTEMTKDPVVNEQYAISQLSVINNAFDLALKEYTSETNQFTLQKLFYEYNKESELLKERLDALKRDRANFTEEQYRKELLSILSALVVISDLYSIRLGRTTLTFENK
jgi:hypothetical protein